ncbi:hypothetical protein GIB67_006146 [Kingdonia uniflora]|uniref:MACPF domain-containing protein n=1 Tax=Kingdonia uniflora TaxID=39325 RepID=A0A7J7LQ74_9MAGN|nr:hypothetical protein GIB67_006146 [Kingdonia uniflora]
MILLAKEREAEMVCEVVENAISCLGKGYDITSAFRLNYCKGEKRLVMLNENDRQLVVPGFGVVENVSVDIKCDKGDRMRYQTGALEFYQMSEQINTRNSLPGKIPTGYFNSAFKFSGNSFAEDASKTKCLAIDGTLVSLLNFHIDHSPLILLDEIKNAVPTIWDPYSLARFIRMYGTHIVVGLSIGGQDALILKQELSSTLEPSEITNHLHSLGDELFEGACKYNPFQRRSRELKRIPEAFKIFDIPPTLIDSFSTLTTKDGITVIRTKRGGDRFENFHCQWLQTVTSNPDAINFKFIPITSLLKHVNGNGYLSHAINLYIRYKPPVSDLGSFLDFQKHKLWAPIHSDHPLGPVTNRTIPRPALRFNLMGPSLHVNTTQVRVGTLPVTGMRLYLEGMKCQRLAIHLEHLSHTPTILQNKIDEISRWRGTDDMNNKQYFEAVQWKSCSHICTSSVEYEPAWAANKDTAFIVTGAQLQVKKHGSKSVLHLRLLFSKVTGLVIGRSILEAGSSSNLIQKSGLSPFVSMNNLGNQEKEKQKPVVLDSGVFSTDPPISMKSQKFTKFIDTSHLCKGAQDSPGHWIVTGAKLDLEKGKIYLQVKFSLLYFSSMNAGTYRVGEEKISN